MSTNMKKVVSVTEVEGEGLESLLGEQVLLCCIRYFYTGKLAGVSEKFALLEGARIVYDTGDWNANGYSDAQKLHADKWYVERSAIESFGVSK